MKTNNDSNHHLDLHQEMETLVSEINQERENKRIKIENELEKG